MQSSILTSVIQPVIETFEKLGISYYIGGSVGSSAYGVARTTIDVDMASNLNESHVKTLVNSLSTQFYLDETAIIRAIQNRSSFNLVHLESMVKIDVFILKDREYDQQTLHRKKKEALSHDKTIQFFVASPEDIILNKLEWYRIGNEVSERQWNDVLGVLRVQDKNLDQKYLHKWAKILGVEALLLRALKEMG